MGGRSARQVGVGGVSSIPTIDDTTHGAIHWFKGYGPVPVAPYTGTCDHWGQGVIAYGWDLKHYELVECGIDGPGNTGCRARAWSDDRGRTTTPWMVPADRKS